MPDPNQTTTKYSAPTSQKDILDHAEALARVEDDAELLAEMAELFLESHVEQLSAIQSGFETRDLQLVRNAAHNLKGAIGNFAAREAFEAARRLEQEASEGNLNEAAEAYTRLKDTLERLKKALAGITEGSAGSGINI
jgi:HPt (histidine-containing phosphotransfer) domain-containing protein